MTRRPHTVAICGGIGSGKSVVSRIVSVMGYPVYDTDTQAQRLMDNSPAIKQAIARNISPEVITADGAIDRPRLASIVFADGDALSRLNSIVHSAVRADFIAWRDSADAQKVFIESAILFESGFHDLADEVWEVTAPLELRVSRVMRRNAISRADVEARIAAQTSTAIPHTHPRLHTIPNDHLTPLLPQILPLL